MTGRYVARSFRVEKRTRWGVVDTGHGRWINLVWSDQKDAEGHAARLNLRGTSRIVPLAGAAS